MIARQHMSNKGAPRLRAPGFQRYPTNTTILQSTKSCNRNSQRLHRLMSIGFADAEICAKDWQEKLTQLKIFKNTPLRPIQFKNLVDQLSIRERMQLLFIWELWSAVGGEKEMHWHRLILLKQITGQAKADQRPHTVPKESKRTFKIRLQCLSQRPDQFVETCKWAFEQTIFPARQLHWIDIDIWCKRLYPGTVQRGSSSRARETKQAQPGCRVRTTTKDPRISS